MLFSSVFLFSYWKIPAFFFTGLQWFNKEWSGCLTDKIFSVINKLIKVKNNKRTLTFVINKSNTAIISSKNCNLGYVKNLKNVCTSTKFIILTSSAQKRAVESLLHQNIRADNQLGSLRTTICLRSDTVCWIYPKEVLFLPSNNRNASKKWWDFTDFLS